MIDDALCGRGKCATVVRAQGLLPKQRHRWHLPEPWNGRLEVAPILFISSNPSFDRTEYYPTNQWDKREINMFFNERFTGGAPRFVDDRFRVRLARRGYARKAPQHWREIHNRAAELLGIHPRDVHAGTHYALTEVVHCKSQKNRGTAEAAEMCAGLYLKAIVERSGARVVVCLGNNVPPHVQRCFGFKPHLNDNQSGVFGPIEIGGHPRLFAFLPQPGSNLKRKFATAMPKQLHQLRRWLQGPA